MGIWGLLSLLNSNSGVIMIILTAIYVFTTIGIQRANAKAVEVASISKNVELMEHRLKLIDHFEESSTLSKKSFSEIGFERRFTVLFPDQMLRKQLSKYKYHRDQRERAESDSTYYREHAQDIPEGVFCFETTIMESFSDAFDDEKRRKLKESAENRSIYYPAPIDELSRWLNFYEIKKHYLEQEIEERQAARNLMEMMQHYVSNSIN